MPSAEQLVYTRATRAYSPSGFEGLQVVHRSAGLTDDDVQQITPCVESIPDSAGQERRHQFFRLADRRCVLAVSAVVAADPKINDPRRASVLMAHALVLDADDFTGELEGNPFEVLNQADPWVTSAQEMKARFEKQGAIVAPADVDRDPDPPNAATVTAETKEWDGAEWKKLVALAKNATKLVGAGKTVFLRGAPTEVAGVLRALFAELRPKYRAACTFDTACLTEGFVPGTFWAVGGTFQPTGADCVEVDLDARQVLLDGTDLGSNLNLDLYERWEATARDAGAREKIVRLGPTVEVLAGVLRPGGELVSVAGLDMDAWRELCAAFPDEIAADLARRLNGWLPKRLADGLGEYLRHALETEAPWWLSQTEAEAGLTDWLAEWIARVQPDLGRADRAKLRELGTRPGGRALAFWGLSTGLWPNHSGARKVLGDMTPAEFATAVRLMGHTIPAARFVHSRHLAAAVEAIARAVIPESEFLSAVSAVLREGGAAVLDPLAERVGGLSAAGARRLARELTDAGAGETALARAVARRVAPQPPARVRPAAQFG